MSHENAYRCDHCGTKSLGEGYESLPKRWTRLRVEKWAGDEFNLDICDDCTQRLPSWVLTKPGDPKEA